LRRILIIPFIFLSFSLLSQNSDIKRDVKYSVEAGSIISSTGETPFWLRANQYGTIPIQTPILALRGCIDADYKKAISKEDQYKLPKFDWGYGLNIVGNLGKESQLLIPEIYFKAKYGDFEIYGGRRKEIVGLVDTTLSSGSYIWSGNALPMPKVQISTPNFVPLGFTKNFLSFKGSYAHGWFENSRTDVKNFYLHQKTLYFRLGKPNWKFHFYGGFNHQVQWGGELLYPDPKNQVSINGKVGSNLLDYVNAVTGKSLAVVGDTTKNGKVDALNRGGNHLGTIDVGFEIHLNKFNIYCYRQSIYEDGSLANLNNIADGLNGISILFKKNTKKNISIDRLVVEYLSTESQGGVIGSDAPSRLRGRDNYFNHGVYTNGWTYYNNTIGTPFITVGQSNGVQVYHIGISGTTQNFKFNIRVTDSNIVGNTGLSLEEVVKEYHGMLQIEKKINRWNNINLSTSLAYSSLGSNVGCYFSIHKDW
jgi:hypothetical protein